MHGQNKRSTSETLIPTCVFFRGNSVCHQLEVHKGSAGCKSHSAWGWVKFAVPTNTAKAGVHWGGISHYTAGSKLFFPSWQQKSKECCSWDLFVLHCSEKREGELEQLYSLVFSSAAATFLCIPTMTASKGGVSSCYWLCHCHLRRSENQT